MILITGFEPFGIIGRILNRNESKIIATRLAKEFKEEVIILPVNESCKRILSNKVKKLKPKAIFLLGQSPNFMIHLEDYKGNKSSIPSELAFKFNQSGEEDMGTYYCAKIYEKALKLNKKSIFIHVPLYQDYNLIKEIFKEFKRCLNK